MRVPTRLRRVCTTHGPVASSPCPSCDDETYDLSVGEDHEFVKAYVRQRKFRRLTVAALVGGLVGYAAMIPLGEVALVPIMFVAMFVLELILYSVQPAGRREVEAAVTSPKRGRRLLSTPVMVAITILASFLLTSDMRSRGLFEDPTRGVTEAALHAWALVPAELFAGRELHTLLTHAVLHADWGHLVGNGIGLMIFGLTLDLRFGRLSCALLLVIGTIAGALAQAAVDPASELHLVGASGAVYALAGASLAAMPKRPWVLNLGGSLKPVPAWVVIPVWMLLLGGFDAWLRPEIAWWAHLGGFAVGALIGLVLRKLPPPQEFLDAEAEYLSALPAE